MRTPKTQQWANQHGQLLDELSHLVEEVARRAGVAGDALVVGESADVELDTLRSSAEALKQRLEEARTIEAIPDPVAQGHFAAGIDRWGDACDAIIDAATARDKERALRGARGLDAGTEEFLCAAAVISRSGQ